MFPPQKNRGYAHETDRILDAFGAFQLAKSAAFYMYVFYMYSFYTYQACEMIARGGNDGRRNV